MESIKERTTGFGATVSYWFQFTFRLAIMALVYVGVCVLSGADLDSDAYKVGGALLGLVGGLVLQCKMHLESLDD